MIDVCRPAEDRSREVMAQKLRNTWLGHHGVFHPRNWNTIDCETKAEWLVMADAALATPSDAADLAAARAEVKALTAANEAMRAAADSLVEAWNGIQPEQDVCEALWGDFYTLAQALKTNAALAQSSAGEVE